jgi:hypothetical protein
LPRPNPSALLSAPRRVSASISALPDRTSDTDPRIF